MAVSRHKLVSILAVGIVIRLILMPISAHPFDVYIWYLISTALVNNGVQALVSVPPLWYHYMMVPVAYCYACLSGFFSSGVIPMTSLASALNFYPSFNVQYVPGMLFNTIVKTPFLLSDIMITILLYKIIKRINNKVLAEKAALLWFLNPFVIWISAAWGMWDTLPALFTLAAFYFILDKKISFSAICLSLAFSLKFYAVFLLIPVGLYFHKTNPLQRKWKTNLIFFAAFFGLTFLLFLPYAGTIITYIVNFFVPNASSQYNISTDPVSNPVAFGLTYWSLYLLNRLFNLPLSVQFLSFLSIVSIILIVAALSVVYWKTSKITFSKPAYDLALVLLLPLLALFLSYRIVDEQWFIWAIPFLIILYVNKQVKPIYYWSLSIIALLYAVLNCPFPFFFLPIAPWVSNALLSMVYTILAIDSIRIAFLVILGCLFSIITTIVILQFRSKSDS
jgi:hypothetical protein